MTKLFISHSSKNANYGNALVDLLTGIGISSEDIIYTSNPAFGIPTRQNIFTWLKSSINEKPFVLYLLSPDYYKSVACLNEMGAGWIIECEHTIIFTPDFDTHSREFQNGVLDPREMGFYINNQDRLIQFVEALRVFYKITNNQVLINQKIKEFLVKIESYQKIPRITFETPTHEKTEHAKDEKFSSISDKPELPAIQSNTDKVSVFFRDILKGRVKDEELLLLHYIIETGRYKLGTGWQEPKEIENIRVWEELQGLNSELSFNYQKALLKFEMRKLTEVNALSSFGNPKELKITEDLQEKLLNLPEPIKNLITKAIARNPEDDAPF